MKCMAREAVESVAVAAETAATPRPRRALWWILAVGLIVRLALLAWFHGEPIRIEDARDYNQLAVSLATDGTYSLNGQRTSLRPPLYPAVVSLVYRACGVENHTAVRVLQIVISLATVVLVYRLALAVYDRRVANWAAAITCFYPSLLGQVNVLLSEVLFTFLLVLACLLVVRYLKEARTRDLAVAGVVIGLGALTRSILWLFPPVLACYLLVASRQRWPARLGAVAAMGLAFAVTLAPWSYRNTKLQECFVAVDVMGGRNFMMGNYEYTPMFRAWDAISLSGAKSWDSVLAAQDPDFRTRSQGQRDKLALAYGLAFVRSHRLLTLKRDIAKFFAFWQLDRSFVAGMARGFFGAPPTAVTLGLTPIFFGYYAVVLILGIYAAALLPPPWRIHVFLLLVIAYMCGLHTLVFGHSRYHLPLMPLIGIYAAVALVHGNTLRTRVRSAPFWAATTVALVFCGSWLFDIVVQDLDRFLVIFG